MLRHTNTLKNFAIRATDGEIGRSHGWMGYKVLFAPGWISGLHWDSETVLDRACERRLHPHGSHLGNGTRHQALEASF